MANKDPFEEIKKHREAIEALKVEAVSGLKEKRKSLQAELASVEAEIEKLTGSVPTEKTRRRRSPSVAITIDQVVKEIKSGRTNNVQISKSLGCSPARVKAVVAQFGKSAGVASTGERASFVYHVKK